MQFTGVIAQNLVKCFNASLASEGKLEALAVYPQFCTQHLSDTVEVQRQRMWLKAILDQTPAATAPLAQQLVVVELCWRDLHLDSVEPKLRCKLLGCDLPAIAAVQLLLGALARTKQEEFMAWAAAPGNHYLTGRFSRADLERLFKLAGYKLKRPGADPKGKGLLSLKVMMYIDSHNCVLRSRRHGLLQSVSPSV